MNSLTFIDQFIPQILDGTKTMTRRIIKPQPTHFNPAGTPRRVVPTGGPSESICCPYGQPGDRLWVQEAWRHTAHTLDEARAITEDIMSGTAVAYHADDPDPDWEEWRPANTMPRWASRILLEITGVRVERLCDISEEDAWAEGARHSLHLQGGRFANENFAHLWERLYGDGSWSENPLVWVITFKRLTP